jgi:fatty-acyl-CoA synthase
LKALNIKKGDKVAYLAPNTIEMLIVHGSSNDGNYDQWLAQYPSGPFERVSLNETDIASLLYTSGTTGKPKGVMLTHRANYLHALSIQQHLRVSDQDTLLHILPMFHVNGKGPLFIISRQKTPSSIVRRALAQR